MIAPAPRAQPNPPQPPRLERWLNAIFAFNVRAGRIRLTIRNLLFVPLWLGLAFIAHPYANFFLDLGYVIAPPRNTLLTANFENFFFQLVGRIFYPDVITTMLVLYIVFRIALRAAASYLQDIFELEQTQTAETFIRQAAFSSPAYSTIHIENAALRREDRTSPVFLIGGPGNVQVHLENAAVFEMPNGASTLVGPTGAQTGGVYVLRPFERLRTVIDLREKILPPISIESRTKDGIPVKVSGVRLQYSIARNRPQFTLIRPYPYTNDAFNYLVYQQKRNRSGGVLQVNIEDLIHAELNSFINTFNLSELLAAIGQPEVAERTVQNNALPANPQQPAPPPNAPNFIPHPTISGRFFQNGQNSFAQRALNRGVRVRWIDIGTWNIPITDIEKKHQEAWTLSLENDRRSGANALNDLTRQTWLSETARLIQETPLTAFNINYQKHAQTGNGVRHVIHYTLQEYCGIIETTIATYQAQGQPVPPELETARQLLLDYRQSPNAHRVGEAAPIPPRP